MTDGILLVDKPEGFTSQDLVNKVKRITNEKKAGHTGTLDPMATGLMVVLLGKATRLAPFIKGESKSYTASVVFGKRTDTFDTTGAVIDENNPVFSKDQLEDALKSFLGKSMQLPPIYSAKKVAGKKLYEYARSGKTVEISPCEVEVHEIHLLRESVPFEASFSVTVSKGTYIRSLCDDLGKKLFTFGAMNLLRRTYAEPFNIKDAATLSMLEDSWRERLLPMETIVSSYKKVFVFPKSRRIAVGGNVLEERNISFIDSPLTNGEICAVYCENEFLAMGYAVINGEEIKIKPNKIFVEC